MRENQALIHETRALLADTLRAGQPVWLTLSSGSMMPALRPADRLQVAAIRGSELQPGDIAVFESGGEWIAHRVVAVRDGMVFTRGDAAGRVDEPVLLDQIRGRVVAVERSGQELPPPTAYPANFDVGLLRASFALSVSLTEWIGHRGWDDFFCLSRQEGLTELIGVALREYAVPADIPSSAFSLFDNARRAAAARNSLCLETLREILLVLADIPVIVLKGAFLAGNVYPSPTMRLFTDFDLLVKPADVPETARRLDRLGYRGKYRTDSNSVPSVTAGLNSVMLEHARGPGVHLHWHLFNSVRMEYQGMYIDMDAIWNSARPASAGGLMLSPEHALVHLAEHAVRHSFDRLIWLRDIAAVIMRFDPLIEWDSLTGICRYSPDRLANGLYVPVYHALFYVSRTMPVYIPEKNLATLFPPPFRPADRLFRRLALRGRRVPEMSLLVFPAGGSGCRARARYIARILFPARTELARSVGRDVSDIGLKIYIVRLSARLCFIARVVWAWMRHIPRVL